MKKFYSIVGMTIIGLAIALLVVLVGVYLVQRANAPEITVAETVEGNAEETPTAVSEEVLDKEAIKEAAILVGYSGMMRFPNAFEGMPIKFQGEVVQTGRDDVGRWMRVLIEDEEALRNEPVIVFYDEKDATMNFVEGDTVRVFGVGTGLFDYETVMGTMETAPSILAVAVQFSLKGMAFE